MTRLCYFVPALLIAASVSAQTAPRPAQLATAKTVFISEATIHNGTANDGDYDTFYANVQALNRFSVVASPAQADLVVEFTALENVGAEVFTLRILDPKSTVVLWSMSEGISRTGRAATVLKNQQTALLNLAGDLKQVCLPTP
jgi:hypothetical protein